MRRQFLLASVGAIALTGSAFAAEPAPPPAPLPPPVPIFSWTGLYVGAQIGGAWGTNDQVQIVGVNTLAATPTFATNFTNNASGVIGGAHLGYNLQIGSWVVGIEGTVDGTSISGTNTFGFVSLDEKLGPQGSVQAHIGYAWDRVLIYATGGAAFVGVNDTYTGFGGLEQITRTRSGWTVGGGIAWAFTDNWSIRAEYRYSDFGRFTNYPFGLFVPLGGTLFATHHPDQNQVQFGVSYKFGAPAPAPVVAKY
jgi:outer membrane immunogenic protein